MKDEKEVVKIRLSTETKNKITEVAEKEYRTFDAQCRLILNEWVKKNTGALK